LDDVGLPLCLVRTKKRGLDTSNPRHPALSVLMAISGKDLGLTDSEHLGAAYRAHPLDRRTAVLHGDGPGILHLPLGTTLDAVCLH